MPPLPAEIPAKLDVNIEMGAASNTVQPKEIRIQTREWDGECPMGIEMGTNAGARKALHCEHVPPFQSH